jgi:membrane-associated phospholipid phosphatase
MFMLASVPIEGTHYLTDMIAGILVAALARAIVCKLLERPQSWRDNASIFDARLTARA